MKAAILTNFRAHDPAYSLCGVVANQAKMITELGGYACKVVVHQGFNGAYGLAEIAEVDEGEPTGNRVVVTERSAGDIEHLTNQLQEVLADVGVVLTHDLIYQASMWKFHVAARRLARQRPDLKWLHWIHSATPGNVAEETGAFAAELQGPFPNSRLVVMHVEERMRKMAQFGYQPHQTVIIPNPLDLAEGYDPAALAVLEAGSLWYADLVAVYPLRLDRGKQAEVMVEVLGELVAMGVDARAVFVDFHSTGGDKATYRDELKALAERLGLPATFTSDLAGCGYHIPHKAVLDLFDFADILIHPSKSESDPLVVPEAAWKGCGLVLNFDLPLFRAWEGKAALYKFSSNVDTATGMPGETTTEYGDRREYMRHVAGGVAYMMANQPGLYNHARVRKERSLQAVWGNALWPAMATATPLTPLAEIEATAVEQASIVIPCWLLPDKDGELLHFTKTCIDSIRQYMPGAEVVIVDNGSQIGADYLEQAADVYIRNEENLGYAPAINQGFEAASRDWLIACNNDVEFMHDWASKAIGAWREDTGIVSSHLLDHDPEMRVGREVPPSPGYFFGALWMVHRRIVEQVGYLDEGFRFGMFEDKDYVNRIQAAGYQLVKVGHCKHVGNATWGKLPGQQEIYLENKARFEAKWPNAS